MFRVGVLICCRVQVVDSIQPIQSCLLLAITIEDMNTPQKMHQLSSDSSTDQDVFYTPVQTLSALQPFVQSSTILLDALSSESDGKFYTPVGNSRIPVPSGSLTDETLGRYTPIDLYLNQAFFSFEEVEEVLEEYSKVKAQVQSS